MLENPYLFLGTVLILIGMLGFFAYRLKKVPVCDENEKHIKRRNNVHN